VRDDRVARRRERWLMTWRHDRTGFEPFPGCPRSFSPIANNCTYPHLGNETGPCAPPPGQCRRAVTPLRSWRAICGARRTGSPPDDHIHRAVAGRSRFPIGDGGNVMLNQPFIDLDLLRAAVRDEYGAVAREPTRGYHFHTGNFLADRLGYPADRVAVLPDAAVESFAGVGNPFIWGDLQPGDTVLDLGSGAGFDALLAAGMVGPTGHVLGVDMTPAMLAKARANAAALGLDHVEFREGYLEQLPVDDASVDVVISNGVLNLCPDKETVLAEAFRVLRPGGRARISDIVVARAVPMDGKADIALWTG
jgi:arsenite methyltransferase